MATAARSTPAPEESPQLQERRRKAQEAWNEVVALTDRLQEEDDERSDQALAEDDAAFARIVDALRGGMDPEDLAFALHSWGTWLHCQGHCHKAVAPLLEAVGLLKPPKEHEAANNLAVSLLNLGKALASVGHLEEVEAALLQVLPLQMQEPELRTSARVHLADAYRELGRVPEALQHAQIAERGMDQLRSKIAAVGYRDMVMMLADVYMAARDHKKVFELLDHTRTLMGPINRPTALTFNALGAKLRMITERAATGAASKAAAWAEEIIEPRLSDYKAMVEKGHIATGGAGRMYIKNVLDVLGIAKINLGKLDEAERLKREINEVEALLQALSDAALVELRAELLAERAAATQPKKKKPTRKQQKRKAAQRRKAEARAATSAAAAAQGEKEEEQDEIDAVAAAIEQQHIEETEPEEPEECAICLGDLPATEEEGAMLLACSHTFHADCLGRWKDKCLEKGLRFTCAMCRGAVVVADSGAGAESGLKSG